MKITRSIKTNAHPKEKETIIYWANCIAWLFKYLEKPSFRNISQVTIKRVHSICIAVSINHVTLNWSNACALFVQQYKSVLLKSYTLWSKIWHLLRCKRTFYKTLISWTNECLPANKYMLKINYKLEQGVTSLQC